MRLYLNVTVALMVLISVDANGYDSLACGEGVLDCEGTTAARTPWVVSEHASIWLAARELSGLPARVDDSFTVSTPIGGEEISDEENSYEIVPFGEVRGKEARQIAIAVFSQLPDKAYSLWDWVSGNEGCPPSPLDGGCHEFKKHMGWLNSNHFVPQSSSVFKYYHNLAVSRAIECSAVATTLAAANRHEPEILESCDREALILESIAHHYLQDAWSMGHMWQRWGSPELTDFEASISEAPRLGSVGAVGDAVGRASGIIHGAKAITKFADAMCAPGDAVEYYHSGVVYPGAGDLYLEKVVSDQKFRH